MTHTIKLTALEAVKVEPRGGLVDLSFRVGGVSVAVKTLTPDLAHAIGHALKLAAAEAGEA